LRRIKSWTDDENKLLKELVENTKLRWRDIGEKLGVSDEQARSQYRHITGNNGRGYAFNKIEESPYPKFNSPLEQTGDCLILPDPEFPYHHSEFLNRCLDLADAWNIRQCTIAGDAMHFNSISKWEANWKAKSNGEISENAQAELLAATLRLPKQYQNVILEKLNKFTPTVDGDVGSEIEIARRALATIGDLFDDVVYVIGNHDGRLLSALNSPMFAGDLKRFVVGDNPKYRIAEYYFSILHTSQGDYSIEHPVSASTTTAVNIATQKHCHVIMGHSHRYSRMRDPSGMYWCIQAGMCVDEDRLAYVAQRTRGRERHSLGAVIVRDGYPYDLSMDTPWETWKKMRLL